MHDIQRESVDWQRREGSPIGPETILPAQFHRSEFTAHLQPEKRLMLAVLEDAVATYQKCAVSTHRRESADFAAAQEWVTAGDQEWPYSFINICLALGLEPDRMRGGLEAWREMRRAGRVTAVSRSPFRRVGGSRHKAGGHAPGTRAVKRVA